RRKAERNIVGMHPVRGSGRPLNHYILSLSVSHERNPVTMFSHCCRLPRLLYVPCVRTALPALLLLGLACSTQAQDVFLPGDTTIDYTIPNTVLIVNVGYANQSDLNNQTNRTNPTIDLVSGGNVGFLRAYNSS